MGQFSAGAVNFVEITLLLVVALLVLYSQSNSTSKKHVLSCVFKVLILILCYTFIYFTQHLIISFGEGELKSICFRFRKNSTV